MMRVDFVPHEKKINKLNEYKSAHWRKTRIVFPGLNLHEFPLFTIIFRRKEPQGSSSVLNLFNKHSIVKLFIFKLQNQIIKKNLKKPFKTIPDQSFWGIEGFLW